MPTSDTQYDLSDRTCTICGNHQGNGVHEVREMMFGLNETFHYLECRDCGCLRILDPPQDMGRYYPQTYYAFKSPHRNRLVALLKRQRARYAFSEKGLIGRALVAAFGFPLVIRWVKDWIEFSGVTLESTILDVGCGRAHLFPDLMGLGFFNISGIDPFLDEDINFGQNVWARRMSLGQVDGTYDFVMLHHSFEHMSDPEGTLHQLKRVVKPDGTVLIRIPLASSYAWRTYGSDWVQLDAPRHTYLHSVRSMSLLAERTGFEISHIIFDSDAFQFWGSEQNRRGIPLMNPASYFVSRRRSGFARKQILEFTRKAENLNAVGDGDSAGFYLRVRGAKLPGPLQRGGTGR